MMAICCRSTPQGIAALCGAQLIANIFLGTSNASTVQPIAGQQRTILYRQAVFLSSQHLIWSMSTTFVLAKSWCTKT